MGSYMDIRWKILTVLVISVEISIFVVNNAQWFEVGGALLENFDSYTSFSQLLEQYSGFPPENMLSLLVGLKGGPPEVKHVFFL